MTNRAPGTIWPVRRTETGFGFPMVRTAEDDMVEIIFDPAVLDVVPLRNVMSLSRADARLLAKRINQCLDSTVKR